MGSCQLLQEDESVFFKDVTLDRLTTLQWMTPLPEICGWRKLESIGYQLKKKDKVSGSREIGMDLEGIEGKELE